MSHVYNASYISKQLRQKNSHNMRHMKLFVLSVALVILLYIYFSSKFTSSDTSGQPILFGTQNKGSYSSIKDCGTWIPLSAGQYDFSPVRSCAVESALRFADKFPVCLVIDRFDLQDLSDLAWTKPLGRRYPGRLATFSPNYASTFADTLFTDFFVESDDYEYLQPVALWALHAKYGGLVMAPTTILLKSLR